MKDKGNDGKGDIPERDEWQTKQELWNKLNKQYKFIFDCCANEKNSKCKVFFNDFKKQTRDIFYMSWMNPPFSKAYEMFEHFFKVIKKGVAIYRCDNMETKVWQDIILKRATWIFIPKGRVSYTPFEVGDMRNGMGTRFPSALIGFNVDTPKELEGVVLFPKSEKERTKDGN